MKNSNKIGWLLFVVGLLLAVSGKMCAQSTQDSVKLAATGKVVGKETRSGKTYQLFQGAKGGKFLIRLSAKSGKYYKQYLPKEVATGK